MATESKHEKITHTHSPEYQLHIPQILEPGSTNPITFLNEDIPRVLDFLNLGAEPPKATQLKVLVKDKFFPCQSTLAGSYLFYENDEGGQQGYLRLGCVPLFQTKVEFPPGGRRVFREHAATENAKGYEFVIANPSEEVKVYIVADSMTLREEWAEAIRIRAEIRNRDTQLRPEMKAVANATLPPVTRLLHRKGTMSRSSAGSMLIKKKVGSSGRQLAGEAKLSGKALTIFGETHFSESDFVNQFFTRKSESDDLMERKKLEGYHQAVKAGLKDMVLEQYKYFVEASREMTVMGGEMKKLKTMVENHVSCLDIMKEIDFREAFEQEDSDDDSDSSGEDGIWNAGHGDENGGGGSSVGSGDTVSTADSNKLEPLIESVRNTLPDGISAGDLLNTNFPKETTIPTVGTPAVREIPIWLTEVEEEINISIYQCRYTEAIDLILKAKSQIQDLLDQNDKLLSIKEQSSLRRTLQAVLSLSSITSNRLTETLRRKNEGLRQSIKRERADPLSKYEPLLSPICLNDDAIALSQLVRLEKTQEAALAFTTRRSLLVMEALNERALGGEGKNDICMYASQLSQGFFSCLAMSVEGFLDLYMGVINSVLTENPNSSSCSVDSGPSTTDIDTMSILTGGVSSNSVPPGAMASIVLWCDTELSKFATVFSGPKLLGCLNLALPKAARDLVDEGVGDNDVGVVGKNYFTNKERLGNIEMAAMCIDQVFQIASENLDSVGLPLSPRLADFIRGGLKGCEGEIAQFLKGKWDHVIYDWFDPIIIAEEEYVPTRRPTMKTANR